MRFTKLLYRIIIVLKKKFFHYFFKITYTNVKFGEKVELEGKLKLYRNGEITIKNKTRIRKWVVLNPWNGYIEIGENCSINSFCHISGNGGVKIGDNVLLATQCVIISANHNFDKIDKLICDQGETRKEIIIEDDCWLGAGVKVLAGVTIGRGSVIGAGSVVTRDIPPYSVCVGIPAKPIKDRRNGSINEK